MMTVIMTVIDTSIDTHKVVLMTQVLQFSTLFLKNYFVHFFNVGQTISS